MIKMIHIFFLSCAFSLMLFSQTLTTIILPQFIQGNTGINSNRIPFAYRVRISGLTVNTTYRYYNQIVNSSDADTSNGGGNCIFVANTGNFVRTSNPGLKNVGAYGTFSTDGSGAYEGWFITEPTGNKRFIPGEYVFMRIILNDGGIGTSPAMRLTTGDSVRVINLDPAFTDSTGTGLRCTSAANPKDFIFIYDNKEGISRPISGSFIESDGTDNSLSNNYATFYANQVNGVNGSFGAILPNVLPNGVQRVERRAFATGTVVVFATDADGIWLSGVNTINPTGGTTALVLAGTDVQWTNVIQNTALIPDKFVLYQNYPNPFNPNTTIRYTVPMHSRIRLLIYNAIGQVVADLINTEQSAGWNQIVWDANVSSGLYFYRLEAVSTESPSKHFVETKKMILLK